MELTKDNAFELGKNRKGWFIGHFMDDSNLKTEDLEIQFINLKKGSSKESTKINPQVKAVTILINGYFELNLPEENKKIILKKQGDFVKFDLSSRHVGTAIEDTKILTIKWPSVK